MSIGRAEKMVGTIKKGKKKTVIGDGQDWASCIPNFTNFTGIIAEHFEEALTP